MRNLTEFIKRVTRENSPMIPELVRRRDLLGWSVLLFGDEQRRGVPAVGHRGSYAAGSISVVAICLGTSMFQRLM